MREKLASKKIYPASGESVLYRYRFEDVLIDFIPYESSSLDPTNSWLKPEFENNITVTIGEVSIKILPVSLYLASKWEAFKSRGKDPRFSHDFEDIIYVIDNNKDVVQEIKNSKESVQSFLSGMSKEIIEHSSTYEIIECHINPYAQEQRRNIVLSKLQEIFKPNGV